jgi:DNA-binding response OmpR family regulator
MKPRIILLLTNDPETEQAAQEAVLTSRRGLRVARNSRDSFQLLRNSHDDVELFIVDLDPGLHGVTLLGAVSACRGSSPVIALTSMEREYMLPLVVRQGVAECLEKPVHPVELTRAIHRLCSPIMEVNGSK